MLPTISLFSFLKFGLLKHVKIYLFLLFFCSYFPFHFLTIYSFIEFKRQMNRSFSYCSKSDMDEVEFSKFHASVKRGDIVGVTGFPGLGCYNL